MIVDIISEMVKFQQQIRVLHWTTRSYARHMAYGKVYEELDDLIDNFVESYQGKMGRVPLNMKFELGDMKDIKINDLISSFTKILTDAVPSQLNEKDTELLNIRDEILGLVDKLKYLLSLK